MGNENNDGYVDFMFSPMKHCACGKSHDIKTPTLILGNGAIDRLKTLIPQYGATKIYLIADKNTERVAGKVVERIINELSIPCAKCIFKEDFLAPNEYAVGSAIMHYESACDLIVAVGSGVINDIGKIVAAAADETVALSLLKDGGEVEYALGDEITLPGEYTLTLTDSLGNTANRSFRELINVSQ